MQELRRKDRLVSDAREIEDIIQRGKACRIAVADGDAPQMIALNYDRYSLENGALELHFDVDLNDGCFGIFEKSDNVCFEISYDDGMHIDINEPRHSTLYFSSIIGNGKIEFSETPAGKISAVRADVEVPHRPLQPLREIKKIVSQNKTCHVAMSDDGHPYIVPLSYGSDFTDDNTLELYFHSATEGRKIDIFRKNNRICFEIENVGDSYSDNGDVRGGCRGRCVYSLIGPRVTGNGEVHFLEGEEKLAALASMFKQQSGHSITITDAMTKGICAYKIVSTDFAIKANPAQPKQSLKCKIISADYTAKKNRKKSTS